MCVSSPPASKPAQVVIDASRGPLNAFAPDQSLGAALDGLPAGEGDRLYTAHNERAMKGAGLRPISYSLRTELAIDAWHWDPEGVWSDPVHRRGYWTSSDHPSRPVLKGWGYALPRRGDSVDQANDEGYSRLDDGDSATFWKSNPYLDSSYTHAPARPQWVDISFAKPQAISAASIRWAEPFARQFEVQYWRGDDDYDDEGRWVDFPGGAVTDGRGGNALLRLSPRPVEAQYFRILLKVSSDTGPAGSNDPRDRMGYAIRELGLGVVDGHGRFIDRMRHTPDGSEQTPTYVSSTDPWHTASDRDSGAEQPGFDRMFASGLTSGMPMIVPVGPLYDTPENAAAEIRFLKRRGYPVSQVEIGEEPDGQNVSPEDFAALYREFAAAVQAANPAVTLGGPNLQDAVSDTWLDQTPDHSWTRRFLAALSVNGHRTRLDFFSFEHYPYDNLCGPLDRKLLDADDILRADLTRLHADGVPGNIPWIITEYGFSAFSGRGEVEMPGALFDADMIAHFLSLGGRASYLLGYGPDELFDPEKDCSGYGELMLFGEDDRGQAVWPTPTYWGVSMLANDWVQPGDRRHEVYGASVDIPGDRAHAVVAYPIKRPDGRWAVLLINRDPARAFSVQLALGDPADEPAHPLQGPLRIVQYDAQQYAWLADGSAGHPTRDDPPRRFTLPGDVVALPPYSLTVAVQSN